jgi:hypothetical protein
LKNKKRREQRVDGREQRTHREVHYVPAEDNSRQQIRDGRE